jgi:hypothetical protein
MSTQVQVHNVESVTHIVRLHGDFCTNILIFTDASGNEVELVLYRPVDAPLSIPSPYVSDCKKQTLEIA